MKRILTLMAWIALCIFSAAGIQAQEAVPPLETGASGELTVSLVYGTGTNSQPLSQVPLALVRVASLETSQGAAIYTTLSPFDSVHTDWSSMNAAQSEQTAQKMMKIAQLKSSSPAVQNTSASGKAVFSNLEPGMYLVYQKSSASINDRFEEMKPFLVSVPSLKDGQWQYRVEASPKTDLIRKTPSGTKPREPHKPKQPNTGTDSQIQLPAVMIMLAAGTFILLHRRFKRLQK